MTKPMLLAEFTRLPPATRSLVLDGLSGAIDLVAEHAPETHRFLRYQWFAAALAAYGGSARTILIEHDGDPVIALPMVGFGPRPARLAAVPGCYWPFRSFPARAGAGDAAFNALIDQLGQEVNALRIGPVSDGDPALQPLLAAARAKGWVTLDRFVADSLILDMATAAQGEGGWPRNSTLRKNRFHEKHLGEHGTLDWRFLQGADLTAGGFDILASVEEKSWIAARTDGRDAKFTTSGHGAFWRVAAEDPLLAAMMWAALLSVDGAPAAFSFDLNAGALKYAIANSYDPAFGKHSPGKLLYYRNLVRAVEDGIGMVDWGAGDSGYKRTIGAEEGPAIRDWLLVRPGLPAMLGRALRHVWERSGQRPMAPAIDESSPAPL
ncbi:MAG: family N-acetyltransferase [Sphingomonas bacterium]|uniref:GNAT family N-acetyltransferase n=1 Tax=Sphingomonas bacterium TaxID=1895847 RepID=UPI00261C19EF|nr:GNAT family N-acetyltransferase [Sphingomonas bacterium]MDB5705436.1 family N-acetyltransferase [Sphingomonas bacterium]